MVRSLRIEYPGAIYHITSRGNKQESIYLSDEDRQLFLDLLSQVCYRCHWICYAYCLMDNHYHLFIETPWGNISKGMQLLNGIYTQKFNRTHQRVGHVFQGRFKGILVQKESYFLELSRYIVLNPVRANIVRYPNDWRWSSYHETANSTSCPKWLAAESILSCFSNDRLVAIKAYKQFVNEGIQSKPPWGDLKNQIYLGTEDFLKDTQEKIDASKKLLDIPHEQYTPYIPANT